MLLSLSLSVCLFVFCLSVSLYSVCLSLCLSVCLSVYLSVSLPICLSVSLFFLCLSFSVSRSLSLVLFLSLSLLFSLISVVFAPFWLGWSRARPGGWLAGCRVLDRVLRYGEAHASHSSFPHLEESDLRCLTSRLGPDTIVAALTCLMQVRTRVYRGCGGHITPRRYTRVEWCPGDAALVSPLDKHGSAVDQPPFPSSG